MYEAPCCDNCKYQEESDHNRDGYYCEVCSNKESGVYVLYHPESFCCFYWEKLEDKPETQTAKWILIRKVETRDIDDGSIERYNITKCSNCGYETTNQTPFCPMCGFKCEL